MKARIVVAIFEAFIHSVCFLVAVRSSLWAQSIKKINERR